MLLRMENGLIVGRAECPFPDSMIGESTCAVGTKVRWIHYFPEQRSYYKCIFKKLYLHNFH
jgi:hypothetical protein